ncbi:MAG: PKD domain-containing protein [Bacteroidia bacterium]
MILRWTWGLLSLVWASHYLGGEISYTCLGPGAGGTTRYRVVVAVYRDCCGIPMEQTISLSYRTITGTCTPNTGSITLTRVIGTGQDVTPLCAGQISACAANCSGSNPYGFEKYEFEGIISLPAGCGKWLLYHTNCCRTSAINTISNPGGTGTAFYAILDNTVSPCNNSPVFGNMPQFFSCVNKTTIYNPDLSDPDGDSLVVSLTPCYIDDPPTAPFNPGFTSVSYIAPYSYTSPFFSPIGINLNPQTAVLTYRPNAVIQTVLCYKVEEYRNGVKIGEYNRDLYMVMRPCTDSPPNNPSYTSTSSTGTISYNPNSPSSYTIFAPICDDPQTTCVDFVFTDTNPPPRNQLTVSWNNPSWAVGATFQVFPQQGDTVRARLCWRVSNATQPGRYIFIITATNNSCPIRQSQDFTFVFDVKRGVYHRIRAGIVRPSGDTVKVDTVCPGAVRQLVTTFLTQPNPGDIRAIRWTPITGLSSATIANPVAVVNSTIEYEVAVRYKGTGAGGNQGACIARDTVRFVVVSDTARIRLSARNICPDSLVCIRYSASSGSPGNIYQISATGDTQLVAANVPSGDSVCFIPSEDLIVYFAQVYNAQGQCFFASTAETLQRYLRPNYTLNIRRARCLGINDGQIEITPTDPAYQYSLVQINRTPPVTYGPQASGLFTNLPPGVYEVRIISTAGGCVWRDTAIVGQGDSVAVQIDDSLYAGCVPFTATFQGTAVGSNLSYFWNFGDGSPIQQTSGPSATHTYTQAGVYRVRLIITNPDGCSDTATAWVNSGKVGYRYVQRMPYCAGDANGILTVVPYNGTSPYTFSLTPLSGAPVPQPPSGTSTDTFTFTGIGTGIYVLYVRDNSGCDGRDTLYFRYTDSLVLQNFTYAPIPLPNCLPVRVDFTVSGVGTSQPWRYFYTWGDGRRDTTTQNPYWHLYRQSGIYTVQVIAQNAVGCKDSLALTLTIPSGDSVDAQATGPEPALGCVPLTAQFTAQASQSGNSPLFYIWDYGDGRRDTFTTLPSPHSYTYTTPGIYVPSFWAYTSPYCLDTVQLSPVEVGSTPQVQIILPPADVPNGAYYPARPITLVATGGADSYQWQAPSFPIGTDSFYTIQYLAADTYCVTLYATNRYGCDTTLQRCILIEGALLTIPNSFTPNGDGINDLFQILAGGIEKLEFLIYDRWGKEVYNNQGAIKFTWDGTYNNVAVPEGVYVYLARYKLYNESTYRVRSGTITILR